MTAVAVDRGGRTLGELRAEIERVDRSLVSLVAERMSLACETGHVKRSLGKPIVDPAREAEVMARVARLARDAGLPEEEMRTLYWGLLAMSRRAQLSCSEPVGGQPIG